MTLESLRTLLASRLPEGTSALEIKELCCHAAGVERSRYLSSLKESFEIDPRGLEDCIARMSQGEPIAYILGQWDFMDYTFTVDRRALIPRDDSVAVIYTAVECLRISDRSKTIRLLDLCCGSGVLGISLALKLRDAGFKCELTLADISDEALSLTAENARKLEVEARIVKVDALSNEPDVGSFEAIICNPPYIRRGDIEGLDPSVRDYEPMLALDGGPDGLIFYRAVSENFKKCISRGGFLIFEVGYDQSREVCDIVRGCGYGDVGVRKDLSGIERVVWARR